MIAYLDAPAEADRRGRTRQPPSPLGRGGLFPLVVVVDLAGDAGSPKPDAGRRGASAVAISDALDNALRTLLSLLALDEKRGQGRAGDRDGRGGGCFGDDPQRADPVRLRDRPGAAAGWCWGPRPRSVARYLDGASDPEAGARFRDLQAAAFPGFATFACIDLEAMTRLADRFRDRLASTLAARQNRPAKEVEGDLEHVLALARLFRAAFVASRIEPDATAMHRTFGVILHGSAVSGPAAP